VQSHKTSWGAAGYLRAPTCWHPAPKKGADLQRLGFSRPIPDPLAEHYYDSDTCNAVTGPYLLAWPTGLPISTGQRDDFGIVPSGNYADLGCVV